jgi:photosystem II stability/assembly factor-like uncharacterized protein
MIDYCLYLLLDLLHQRYAMRHATVAFLTVSLLFVGQLQLSGQSRHASRADDPAARNRSFARGRTDMVFVPTLTRAVQPRNPAEKLRAAFHTQQRLRALRAVRAGAHWTEMGPRPEWNSKYGMISGRVTALALDLTNDPSGNTLYVGTAFGGLWKSTNALAADPSFKALSDGWPTLAIGSILVGTGVRPSDVHVGTGEANNSLDSYYGLGIMSSQDRGTTWPQDPTSSADTGESFSGAAVGKMVLDPSDPKTVLATVSTASGSRGKQPGVGVYQSTNAGQTWQSTFSGVNPTDIIFEPQRKRFYAAIQGRGVFYREAGTQWQATNSPFGAGVITDSNFWRAAVATRNGTLWVLVSNSRGAPSQPQFGNTGLFESRDGGEHWNSISIPNELFNGQGYYDIVLSAPTQSQFLIIGGIDLWKSSDIDGRWTEWKNMTESYTSSEYSIHPDQHAFVALDEKTWFLGNDGGIWRTDNAGSSWNSLNGSIGTIQMIGITSDLNHPDLYLAGSQDNGTAYSSSSIPMLWNLSMDGDGGYTSSVPQGNGVRFFTERTFVSLFYSDDPNGEWLPIVDSATIDESSEFYVPFAVLPRSNTIVLGTTRVWRGSAQPKSPGAGWQPTSAYPLTYANVVSIASNAANENVVIAATADGKIFGTKTIDQIDTWVDISQTLPTSAPQLQLPIGAVAFDPTNATTIYATLLGFQEKLPDATNSGHIYKSTDFGAHWINISGNLPDIPVSCIIIDPKDNRSIYVGTDLGVYATSDGGTSNSAWVPFGDGLPNTPVLGMTVQEKPQTWLVAGTHGRGAWRIPLAHP